MWSKGKTWQNKDAKFKWFDFLNGFFQYSKPQFWGESNLEGDSEVEIFIDWFWEGKMWDDNRNWCQKTPWQLGWIESLLDVVSFQSHNPPAQRNRRVPKLTKNIHWEKTASWLVVVFLFSKRQNVAPGSSFQGFLRAFSTCNDIVGWKNFLGGNDSSCPLQPECLTVVCIHRDAGS